jgi:hypothetical protein
MYHNVMVAPFTDYQYSRYQRKISVGFKFRILEKLDCIFFLECLECRILICLLQIDQYQVKIHHVTLNSLGYCADVYTLLLLFNLLASAGS